MELEKTLENLMERWKLAKEMRDQALQVVKNKEEEMLKLEGAYIEIKRILDEEDIVKKEVVKMLNDN